MFLFLPPPLSLSLCLSHFYNSLIHLSFVRLLSASHTWIMCQSRAQTWVWCCFIIVAEMDERIISCGFFFTVFSTWNHLLMAFLVAGPVTSSHEEGMTCGEWERSAPHSVSMSVPVRLLLCWYWSAEKEAGFFSFSHLFVGYIVFC